MIDTQLLYTGEDIKGNWFYNKYYYGGANSRYYTFQLALNLLHQRHKNPVIIETGCQRQEEDVGAGMSTSIFAEYIQRYGGSLITVDIDRIHLARAQSYVTKWPEAIITFVPMDSVSFLKQHQGQCDLLYLDSLDYPVGENDGNLAMQYAAQEHCLNEFLAIESKLPDNIILLIDDNQFGGGGKPKLLKEYLLSHQWICLLDLQSSLWIKLV